MAFRVSGLKKDLKGAWAPNRRLLFRNVSAWAIFGAIIVVFVFWGLTPEQPGVSSRGSAATVNGEIISVAEFVERVEILNQDPRFGQLKGLGGDFFTRYLRSQAIQSLVDGRLLSRAAEQKKLFVADSAVRDVIQGIPAFQDQGRFSRTRYMTYLQSTRQDAAEFESKVRTQMLGGQLARVLTLAVAPTAPESKWLSGVENYSVEVEALTLSPQALAGAITVSDAQVAEFLASGESQARVKTYFEENKSEFETPEQVKVRHILIKANAESKEGAQEAARKKAEQLKVRLDGGEDFEKMARVESEDPGSKDQGGLIDYFARGVMAKEFEDYSFSGPVGVVSAPVQTSFGYHLIRVEDRKPKSQKTLPEAEAEIAKKLVAQDQSKKELAQLGAMLAAGDTKAVEEFASRNRLVWKKSGPIKIKDRYAGQLGAGDAVVTQAFRLNPGRPYASELVQDGDQSYVLRYSASGPTSSADSKGSKPGSAAPEANQEELPDIKAARRAEVLLAAYMQAIRSKSEVSINQEVVGEGRGL